jgi:hypothetical protein
LASCKQAKIPFLLIFLIADVETRNVTHSPVSGTKKRLRFQLTLKWRRVFILE